MHNSKYQCHMAACCTYHRPTSPRLLNRENIEEFSEKSQENWPAGRKKDRTESATGHGRGTREEIVKWNQMTALKFQRGETSDIPSLLRTERERES